MSEEGQDRTEPASPRRREDARKQGQVAYSPDFLGSALLLGGIVGLMWLGPAMAARLRNLTYDTFRQRMPVELDEAGAAVLLGKVFIDYLLLVGPLLAVFLAVSVGLSLVQVGFHITPERIEPDFEKLSPAKGMAKLFSVAALVKGLFALVKIVVLGGMVLLVLRARVGTFHGLAENDVLAAATVAWDLVIRLALYLAVAFALLGTADYVYQKYRFEQSLRMTKQEVKEEARSEEGDPLIKARRRQIHREMGRRRMLQQVPRATVVLTNPIHYAVALRYARGEMAAPVVVARGAGVLARAIADRARAAGVPVLERPPLARALYFGVAVDQEVPQSLFVAVAEIIAFLYRMRAR